MGLKIHCARIVVLTCGPERVRASANSVAIGPKESVSRSGRSLRSGLGFDQLIDVRQILLPADEPLVIDEILLGDVESLDIAV